MTKSVAVWMIALGVACAQEVAFVTMTPQGIAKVHEGAARARRRLTPCSTFKIPNSAIGLETGVIPSPDHVIRFEPAKHRTPGFFVDAWARDHDLRSAFRASAVWYFREISLRNGKGTMQNFVNRFEYGNRDASAWPENFWIGSTLRISPVEQVEFLEKLFANRFGLSPKTVDAIRDFMLQERNGSRTLYYKTGACTDADAGPTVWLVGFVEDGAQRTYFAMNAGGVASLDEIMPKRIEFGVERLIKLGLWSR